MKIHYIGMLILTVGLLGACNKASTALWEAERQQIRDYLASNGVNTYIEDSLAGYFYYPTSSIDSSLSQPVLEQEVEVRYKGYFLDGTLFYDSEDGSGVEFVKLEDAIYGWQVAFQQIYVQSTGVLILPSRLAYGEEGLEGLVPPNSILRFEFELREAHPHF